MIPTSILIGLVLATTPPTWAHRALAIAGLATLVSIGFGLLVAEPAGGAALAAANIGVGFGVGLAGVVVLRLVGVLPARPDRDPSAASV